ncbi:MAG: tryptophan 7-halogenase [Chitinophagaceae bacterium]|nr:MAG: tryptophan 7-halogenase [Chitinophagaceae bacterium]
MTTSVKKIVIVGGGTAGWMTAAGLKHHFKNIIDITLIDSSEIATVGVGEATIPTIRNFYRQLGMHDLDVMRATKATAKLGIQFNGWYKKGSSFIHPFGLFGQDLQGIEFHHFWLKLHRKNKAVDLGNYSLGAMLAQHNKFTTPISNPPSSLSVFDWALHFDAALFAAHMQQFSVGLGVHHIDSTILNVNIDDQSGFISSVDVQSGQKISADLFIDCSGFRGLLIEQALQTGYEAWSDWLLCDSAYAVQSKSMGEPNSYTKVTARTAGWQWQIPLQHRHGNGHVFSSRFISDEEACDTLIKNISAELTTSPKKLTFIPGRRKKAWNKNCVAIGLSAGFLEPLESTSIALIQTGIEKIKVLLQNAQFGDAIINEFNETTALEYERVRDFIILHYKATVRDDSEFWRYCKTMSVPDSLRHKMELFKANGHIVNYRWEMFHLPSWLAIFAGFNYLPETYNVLVDTIDEAMLEQSLEKMRGSIINIINDVPTHQEFISNCCAVVDE